ncbi:MAG TPA: transporter [Candidatus Limiplasma pullicola]|nr:transporter [Candidatus Limiplasma pullicola]
MSRPNARSMLLLHGTLLIYAVVSVFAKLAGLRLAAQEAGMTLVFLAAEAAALLAYSLLWQRVLRRMPLNFAYSNKGVCTLWTALFGLAFFGEQMTFGKAAGLAAVLAGVALVVTDHE